jgi:hypothetical protein
MKHVFRITLALFILACTACIYIAVRVEWVYRVRMEVIQNSRLVQGRLSPYVDLPSHEEMVLKRFWIWDRKEIIKSKRGGVKE